jgi:[citrate (pro-3S)-lyase] ligase
MSDYQISPVYPGDRKTLAQVEELLRQEGIRLDPHVDYTCVMFDENYNAIATGSCFGNTLRCMAVSKEHQGESLMNEIVSHLIQYEYERGYVHLFLYTKCSSAKFFQDMGFHEIARVEDQVVFMEQETHGFDQYLDALDSTRVSGNKIAAVVMNANPFTLGHRFLVEKAASENDWVHLFMVSEDASFFPYSVRKQLIMEGTADFKNLIYHDSGPYIISNATFPSYFQKDSMAVIESHANLDLTIFVKIARRLGITVRYVGEEPTSTVTRRYNEIMSQKLPEAGIGCRIISRNTTEKGEVVSASTVRRALHDDDWDTVRRMVPATTLAFLQSDAAKPIIAKIKAEQTTDVIHY